MQSESITKRDAAFRQLRQAIRLFFADGDMLAVHTLAAAANQLYVDIGRPRGIHSVARDTDWIRPERMKEWITALNATQNFLKHADRDLERSHSYFAEGTIFLLFETADLARRLGEKFERELLAYLVWFFATHPDVVLPELGAALAAANRENVDQTDKSLWAAWLCQIAT